MIRTSGMTTVFTASTGERQGLFVEEAVGAF